MNERTVTQVKIVSTQGKVYQFDQVNDFQLNTKNGLLNIRLDNGEFNLLIDRLRCFEVGLSPQEAEIRYKSFAVRLAPLPGGAEEDLDFQAVVNYKWNINHGLFMVFGRDFTAGFHLDHLISFSGTAA